MQQLILNLEALKPASLETFVTGRNAEAAALLKTLANAQGTKGVRTLALDQRFVYLWGESGAGKTHLLQAMAALPGTRLLACKPDMTEAECDAAFAFDPTIQLYLIDDCDRLVPAAQIAAFGLYNQVREHGAALVACGALPPTQLALREDLRTRLGWGLIYHLHELTDDEKIEALGRAAQSRALVLSAGVLPYLITHFQRDMRSLSALLDALDRYSLETQRPITLPLLRSLLQRQGEPLA
ncbi:MAG: DnaA regulatory inactivator Hda [Pseudomonadota bacterium]